MLDPMARRKKATAKKSGAKKTRGAKPTTCKPGDMVRVQYLTNEGVKTGEAEVLEVSDQGLLTIAHPSGAELAEPFENVGLARGRHDAPAWLPMPDESDEGGDD